VIEERTGKDRSGVLGSMVVLVDRPKVIVLMSETVVAVLRSNRFVNRVLQMVPFDREIQGRIETHEEVIESDLPKCQSDGKVPLDSAQGLVHLVVV